MGLSEQQRKKLAAKAAQQQKNSRVPVQPARMTQPERERPGWLAWAGLGLVTLAIIIFIVVVIVKPFGSGVSADNAGSRVHYDDSLSDSDMPAASSGGVIKENNTPEPPVDYDINGNPVTYPEETQSGEATVPTEQEPSQNGQQDPGEAPTVFVRIPSNFATFLFGSMDNETLDAAAKAAGMSMGYSMKSAGDDMAIMEMSPETLESLTQTHQDAITQMIANYSASGITVFMGSEKNQTATVTVAAGSMTEDTMKSVASDLLQEMVWYSAMKGQLTGAEGHTPRLYVYFKDDTGAMLSAWEVDNGAVTKQ